MKTGLRHKMRGGAFLILPILLTLALAACGGGGGGGGGGTSPAVGGQTSVVSRGVMTKGSVILNGIRYTAGSGAAIKVDDNPSQLEDKLRDGMEINLKGKINDDRITGEFEKIEAEPEVRGRMGVKGLDDFLVNGERVLTDDSTKFEDRIGGAFSAMTFAALANGNEVEIHGGRDDLGNIRASRVERRDDNPLDELKGKVSALSGQTFTLTLANLTTVSVTFSPTGVTPAGGALANGQLVELHGTFTAGTPPTFSATRVDIEDLEDDEFEPAEGQEFEVEGFISGFTVHPGSFKVGPTDVDTTAATRFENGSAVDLANNVKVEAEGHFNAATKVLRAEKIKFKRTRIILGGEITASSASSITLLGKTMAITSATEIEASTAVGARIEARGFEDATGNLVAERIKDPGGGGKDILQARVTATNGTNNLTLLGITAVAAPGAVYKNDNDAVINAADFFAKVFPKSATNPGTLVKIKGNLAGGSPTYEEAELEN